MRLCASRVVDSLQGTAGPKQRHIQLETCLEHGVFMDAGEFVDYTNEAVMDIFRGVLAIIKGE